MKLFVKLCNVILNCFYFIYFVTKKKMYPLFHGIQLLVVTVLSHRYNSRKSEVFPWCPDFLVNYIYMISLIT